MTSALVNSPRDTTEARQLELGNLKELTQPLNLERKSRCVIQRSGQDGEQTVFWSLHAADETLATFFADRGSGDRDGFSHLTEVGVVLSTTVPYTTTYCKRFLVLHDQRHRGPPARGALDLPCARAGVDPNVPAGG